MQYFLTLAAHPGAEMPGAAQPAYAFTLLEDGRTGDRSRRLPAAEGWDLHLILSPPNHGHTGLLRLAYDPACFSEARARALLGSFSGLLEQIGSAARLKRAELALATAYDRAGCWPEHPPAPPCALDDEPADMDALFAAIEKRWPYAAAAVWEGDRITFAGLGKAAQAVSKALQAGGARADDIVAFQLPADAPAISRVLFLAAQIAAFRLGCAVLPLGQQQPDQGRVQLEAAGAGFIIRPSGSLDCAPSWASSARQHVIGGFRGAVLLARGGRAERLGGGAGIVLTTSGTTGIPKSIRISQAMLLGLLRGMAASGNLPAVPSLMGPNIGFDMALADVWFAWVYGQAAVMLETERRTPSALAVAHRLGARAASLSPTVAAAALRDDPGCFTGFHTIFLIGEVVPRALVKRLAHAAPELKIVNGYGPAETAIFATVCRVQAADEDAVPIGWALPGYTVIVADPVTGTPLPPHWPGELLIASPAPALGYVDAARTAERFAQVPGEQRGPFFRSGDIGYIGADGQVQFLGRRDRQYKLAGVRVELDGIEHVISQVAGVAETAVLVTGQGAAARVIAVAQPSERATDLNELRTAIFAHCRAWLPRAAVPAKVVFVDSMPTGDSGKKSSHELFAVVENKARDETALNGFSEDESASTKTPVSARLYEDGQGGRNQSAAILLLPLDAAAWNDIEVTALREGLTAFMLAWTAYALLLNRLAGGLVCLWTCAPVLDRPKTGSGDAEWVLGSIDLDAAPDFAYAARLASEQLRARARYLPNDMPELEQPRYAFAGADEAKEPGHWRFPKGGAWDLLLLLHPPLHGNDGELRLCYDPGCFSDARARSLLRSFGGLLTGIGSQSHLTPREFAVAAVHDRAVSRWAEQQSAEPCALDDNPSDMAMLFDATAARWPRNMAALWEDGGVTFTALRGAADDVANALQDCGAQADDIVAFRLTTGATAGHRVLFLATQIAVFRLDCAVLPIGQQQQPAQARAQIEAVGAGFLIDPSGLLDLAPAWSKDVMRHAIEGFPGAVLLPRGEGARRLARQAGIVFTTSGTTGVPKAICLSQAMLLGSLRGMAESGQFAPAPGLMGANIAFYMSFVDVWFSWIYGRHVVLLETERRTPSALALAYKLGARMMCLSPTVAAAALRDDPGCFRACDTLILAGEIVPRMLVKRLSQAAPGLAVINGYGPAETAMLVTACRLTAEDDDAVPIGWALPGYTALVADPATGTPLPPHWPGELLIASAAPALGYVDAAMTAARFIQVPGEPNGPFFRSGDMGYVGTDGQVRFLGRRDRQRKIAGVRIELDGIEHVISQVRGIEEAVAVVSGQDSSAQVMVIARAAPSVTDRAALRAAVLAHCRAWLQRAAVPARLFFVDAMPTGASGKKSYEAMLAMLEREADDSAAAGRLPSPGTAEATLAAMWDELLRSNGHPPQPIYLDDDVFALGATSLDAIIMAERIEKAWGTRFPDHQMFVRPTVAAQAAFLLAARQGSMGANSAAILHGSVEFRLVREALGSGPSRGIALGMPQLAGDAFYSGLIAANMFDELEVWTCVAHVDGRLLNEDGVWQDVARAIFEAIASGEMRRPRTLFGFSIGGWIGWLVDRLLAGGGHGSLPVVNFDGSPLQFYYAGWQDKVAAFLPPLDDAPPAWMLLLHRPHRCWYDADYRLAEEWVMAGVQVQEATLRSVRHLDIVRSEFIAMLRNAVPAFIEGTRSGDGLPRDIAMPVLGTALVAMLEGPAPPRPSEMRALLESLPSGAVDREIRVPLLFIAVCSGDARLALGLARRLATEDPMFRAAAYAEIAVLAALGQKNLALACADIWLSRYPKDLLMRTRVETAVSPASWDVGPETGTVRCPEQGLDFAAGILVKATTGQETPG